MDWDVMRESVYVESSVISYLMARPSRDIVIAARQAITETWWCERRPGIFNFPENPEQDDQKIRESQEMRSLIELFGSEFSGVGFVYLELRRAGNRTG
uniref:Uncharacterized protein n=1 Tax=Candidatus Kentrum sp. FM TaxID=2126340 RepID=A0A450T0W8_9GAMM|nr:MAG: hypothetical protein BECKFM1743A_GA0114220_102565 [Candidatus Kentron sp. FM]VFJ60707.1 MAG: hypothetical protein BECKFM1743C_GA0114222_102785 [Candidatus Kentron sp. FM]VFK13292.1 MAG: hypothetical protein BECKFM1743B_GA0114221_102754 [Candidatus Kentron sp. FM]